MKILPISGVQASGPVLRAYETALAALRGPDFEAAVVDSFRGALTWERLYLYQGAANEESALRMARYEPSLAPLVPIYQRDYMRTDPLNRAVQALDDHTHTIALRLEPADIAEEGYRRIFFEDREIVERVSILQRSKRGWRGVNIARHRRAGRCTASELSVFASLGQLILPLVDTHFELPEAAPWRENLTDIEVRFQQGFPVLTERERQVCARAALGMSVEATALDLGIGRTSVLTYRRRAYGRLQVTSPYELAALVLH